jgi:periplasmic divalent cation tolerance protein
MARYCILTRQAPGTHAARLLSTKDHGMTDKLVVLVTCANRGEAARLARALVEQRAAACVNIVSAPVQSVYRWKGRVASAREVLLVIKSSRARFSVLRALVQKLHSYDVPEVLALPIAAGAPGYLRWLDNCLRASRKAKASGAQRVRSRSRK